MTAQDLNNFFTRYWQIFVVMVGLIGSWYTLSSKVSMLERAMADEQSESKTQDKKQVELDKAIVKIETTQTAMKEDIDDIKAEQQDQSKKLDKIIEKLSER